jgi:hypothetical protein
MPLGASVPINERDEAMKRVKISFGVSPIGGSTIVGVLAAIVFISVVAAFMVKNTGAHSSASVGYASSMTMHSTVRSGIAATESFLWYSADSALKIINSLPENGEESKSFIFGKNGKEKARLSANQFFSSRIAMFDEETGYSQIVVSSAKSAAGKSMKNARAFYRLGNLTKNDIGKYGGKNAVYMKGGLANGDNGMEVFGNATFEGNAKFQNCPGIFHGEAFFQENVSVMHGGTVFHDKAYFGGNANFQNFSGSHNVFESDVGFNKNYATQGSQSVRAAGDVYIKGDFRAADEYSDNFDGNAYITSTGADKTFYYTDKLSLQGENCVINNGSCSIHGYNHINPTNIKNFSQQANVENMDVLDRLKMAGIEERRDPQLDIKKIPNEKIKPAYQAITTGSQFSLSKLNEAFDAAKANDELYNGHLVLKVGKNDPNINWPGGNPGTFNDKVIFIIEDDANTFGSTNGNFYNSGPSSSTMIFVGAGNATLQQFGTSGLFRGLIYIDEANTSAQNSFNWKNGGYIEGAFHNFSSKNFEWNAGQNSSSKIVFDENVLNAFGSLVKGGSGGDDGTTELENEDDGIYVDVGGYYYY